MPHPLFTATRTLFIAHRGVSAYAPGNTLEAFRLAPSHGFDGIETDIQLTADHVPVLHHDSTITFGDQTVEIAHLTVTEIKKSSPMIPTLAEALAAVPTPLLWQLELKNPHPALAHIMKHIVQEYRSRIYFTSFSVLLLNNILHSFPDSPRILLLEKMHKRAISIEEYIATVVIPHRLSGISIHALEITEEIVERCRKHHLLIGAWGIKSDLKRFQQAVRFPLSFMTLDAPLFSTQ